MMKTISIIIISYNRLNDTIDLLNDIAVLNNPELLSEVIILNNKSSDDYSAINSFIKRYPKTPFKLIEAPENLGVSRGRNYASGFATGDIYFYIDDDVCLRDINTLSKIVTAFNSNNKNERPTGVVSFKVRYFDTLAIQLTAFPHKKYEKYKDKPRFFTSYYAGCAHAKTKEAWLKAGPYPTDFFYGMEEYDFSYRVLDAGFNIEYNDIFEVLHKESPLGRNTKLEKLSMMWLNKSKVAWRYLPIVYFYSTAFMWSLEFLKKSGFNWNTYFRTLKKVISIPGNEKRYTIQESTLAYLKDVEARLWF